MTTEVEQRAEAARQLLDNPVFQEAFDGILDGLMEAIADAPVDDANLRNQLGLQVGAAKMFKESIMAAIDDKLVDEQAQEYEPPHTL